jgi:tetratricopeptide (TPR) repeat protein
VGIYETETQGVSMKVFVSSTTKDLEEARKKVCEQLLKLDMQPVSMDSYVSDQRPPMQLDDDKVKECDAFVIIVGHLYGSCPKGEEKSFTELEYEVAVASGMDVYPFLASDKFPLSPNLREDDATYKKLQAFRKRLEEEHTPSYFDNADILCADAVAALKDAVEKVKLDFPFEPSLHNQTPPEVKFVGRKEMLDTITQWYKNPEVRIGGLIGWGGVGKSALVRKWYDSLKANKIRPDGIFWWGFYRNASLEQFLNALLRYVSGGQIEPDTIKSTWEKADRIKEYIGWGAYLIILDGLEQMQEGKSGDEFGKMNHPEFTELLHYLAEVQKGLCLITTRYRLKDLDEWYNRGYENRLLLDLSIHDALLMLKKRGVKGSDDDIKEVVERYKGHALSLTLLAGYLKKFYDRDIKKAPQVKFVLGDKKRFEDVNKLLQRYAEKMSGAERVFLNIFSLFRQEVTERDFEGVFHKKIEDSTCNDILVEMSELDFKELIIGLVDWRLISCDEMKKLYTIHPLIKGYFESDFSEKDKKLCHKRIYKYFGEYAPEEAETLKEMQPLFEQVYHGCAAGLYDEVFNHVYWEKIKRREDYFITRKLGAWETDLSIAKTFFPEGDLSQMPLVSKKIDQSWLLNAAGLALLNTGRSKEAKVALLLSAEIIRGLKDWKEISMRHQNLADLQFRTGELESGLESAKKALEMAEEAKSDGYILFSKGYLGWVLYLLGRTEEAEKEFGKADELEGDISGNRLYSGRGVFYADFLMSMNRIDLAIELTKQNLEICQCQNWPDDISRCHRCLSAIKRIKGNYKEAEGHIRKSLDIARKIGYTAIEIEALIESARLHFDMEEYEDAIGDAENVLKICGRTGFRLYEPGAEVVLAKAYLGQKDNERAENNAKSAYGGRRGMRRICWGRYTRSGVIRRMGGSGLKRRLGAGRRFWIRRLKRRKKN